MKKPKTISQLKKELDAIVSKYVRQKYSINGNCKCYTCGKIVEINKIQCGHFVSRGYLATRFDENNLRPQCIGCNIFGNGKPLDFEENLKKELGSKKVEALKMKRHQVMKIDSIWYQEQIENYKNKLKELEKLQNENTKL